MNKMSLCLALSFSYRKTLKLIYNASLMIFILINLCHSCSLTNKLTRKKFFLCQFPCKLNPKLNILLYGVLGS